MQEYITLNNGKHMPVLGLGTSLSKVEDLKEAVKTAIREGYRHIDCSAIYGNEDIIGDAIEETIDNGIVKRNELFVTSKLWPTFQSPGHVREGLELSLRKLKLDYLDSFHIHWPFGLQYVGKTIVRSRPTPFDETIDYLDTWKMLEQFYESGIVKSIGVSNFNLSQLKRLLANSRVIPAVHQIEFHPYFDQEEMLQFCVSNGIAVTSYSPFASPSRPWVTKAGINVFKDPLLIEISKKYKRSVGQIVLRYLVQRGTTVIPKSTTPSRIEENSKIFDFTLQELDVAKIKTLNCNKRVVPSRNAFFVSHKNFPFSVDDLV